MLKTLKYAADSTGNAETFYGAIKVTPGCVVLAAGFGCTATITAGHYLKFVLMDGNFAAFPASTDDASKMIVEALKQQQTAAAFQYTFQVMPLFYKISQGYITIILNHTAVDLGYIYGWCTIDDGFGYKPVVDTKERV